MTARWYREVLLRMFAGACMGVALVDGNTHVLTVGVIAISLSLMPPDGRANR